MATSELRGRGSRQTRLLSNFSSQSRSRCRLHDENWKATSKNLLKQKKDTKRSQIKTRFTPFPISAGSSACSQADPKRHTTSRVEVSFRNLNARARARAQTFPCQCQGWLACISARFSSRFCIFATIGICQRQTVAAAAGLHQ